MLAEKMDSVNPNNDDDTISHSLVDSNDLNSKEADEQRSRDLKAGLHPLKVPSCPYLSLLSGGWLIRVSSPRSSAACLNGGLADSV